MNDIYQKLKRLAEEKNTEELLSAYSSNISRIEQICTCMQDVLTSLSGQDKDDAEALINHGILPRIYSLVESYQKMAELITKIEDDSRIMNGAIDELGFYQKNVIVHINSSMYKNAGDYMLTDCLERLVSSVVPDIKWQQVSISRRVDEDLINKINKARALVIGGGGLFLTDSMENRVSGWQWACPTELMEKITVPIYVLAVGYNRFRGQEEFGECFSTNVNRLLERSRYFGLRNKGSMESVGRYVEDSNRDRISLFPCATTVISRLYDLPKHIPGNSIAINCAFDRSELRFGDKKDKVLSELADVAGDFSANHDILLYLHCPEDVEMAGYLDQKGVRYERVDLSGLRDKDQIIEAYMRPDLVIGMRGHSQMIAFGVGTPTVSIVSHDKLQWFLDDIGHPEWGVDVRDPSFRSTLKDKVEVMLVENNKVREQIEEAKSAIWDQMEKGLSVIRKDLRG